MIYSVGDKIVLKEDLTQGDTFEHGVPYDDEMEYLKSDFHKIDSVEGYYYEVHGFLVVDSMIDHDKVSQLRCITRVKTKVEDMKYYDFLDSRTALFDLLDEMESFKRPAIESYIAEFIEYHKTRGGTIHSVTNLDDVYVKRKFPKIYRMANEELQEVIARAWLNGYVVEEEE